MTAQEDRLPLFPDDDDAPADEAKQERQRKNPRNTLNDLSGTEWIKSTKSWLICDSRRYNAKRETELPHVMWWKGFLESRGIRFSGPEASAIFHKASYPPTTSQQP